MRESLMYGSVRGARGNSRPYRDMLECLLLPERALKEGKTFSDMANELVEIGLFDPKEAEE